MTKVVETELASERAREREREREKLHESKIPFERTWNKIKVRTRIWRKM